MEPRRARTRLVQSVADALVNCANGRGLAAETSFAPGDGGQPVDFTLYLGEYLFATKCKFRHLDGTVTAADIVRLRDAVRTISGSMIPARARGILATNGDIPYLAALGAQKADHHVFFLTGSPRAWALAFDDLLSTLIACRERGRLEQLVEDEFPHKRAKNFTAALAATAARFIDLAYVETTVARIEEARGPLRRIFRAVFPPAYPPRGAMDSLFTTHSIRAISKLCTEITRNSIAPKSPEMRVLIDNCYEELARRLPNRRLHKEPLWRGTIYASIQRICSANLIYYDRFRLASPKEAEDTGLQRAFRSHFGPKSEWENAHRHAVYEFDDFFRGLVEAFVRQMPTFNAICSGQASIDPEVHFLYSLYRVLTAQLAYMPVYRSAALYREANIRMARAYRANLWPILYTYLTTYTGERPVSSCSGGSTVVGRFRERLWLLWMQWIRPAGHRYLQTLRERQEALGGTTRFALGKDGLYLALGEFIREVYRFVGRWECMTWAERLPRRARGVSALLRRLRDSVWAQEPSQPLLSGKPGLDAGPQELFNICVSRRQFAESVYNIPDLPQSDIELSALGINGEHLRDLYVNQVLSGFCNVTNLLSRGSVRLLGSLALALESACPVRSYDRIVAIPSMGVVPASLLSFLRGKRMCISHTLLSLDMWPRPSRFERLLLVDDGTQTGFTAFSVLRELEKARYRVADIPVLTIYRYHDDQIGSFRPTCNGVPELDVIRALAATRERIKSCFDFRVKSIAPQVKGYEPECVYDMTDYVDRDAADRFMEEAKSRILRVLGKEWQVEKLRKRIRWSCKSGRFYKPCLLFEHPGLLLRVCAHFHRICQDENIDTLLARDEFGIPLAVGVCLIRMLSGDAPRIRLLVAQKGGTFIEGLTDLLKDLADNERPRIATIGTALRTQATEHRIEQTLKCASLPHEALNPRGASVQRTHILTVFQARYFEHLEPLAVPAERVYHIVSVGGEVHH